jgi:hypothetical protein
MPRGKFVPLLRLFEKARTRTTGKRPMVERICTMRGGTSLLTTVEKKPHKPKRTIAAKLYPNHRGISVLASFSAGRPAFAQAIEKWRKT